MSYKERILNFFSQKINTNDKILNIHEIEEEYYNLLTDILDDCELCIKKRTIYFSVLYRLIFYTRDVVYGINNHEAAFIMIGTLIQFGINNPSFSNEMNILASNALGSFIQIHGFHTAYGNWNDIRYFANYLKNVIVVNNKNRVSDYHIFKYIIDLYCNQLANEEKYSDIISTVTQYMPREKSKLFGWLAYYISTTYYQSWINTATNNATYLRAVRKCLTHYRGLIGNPNKLPLYTYEHTEINNKIIDNWTKLLFELSNDRYEWANEFSETVLEEYFSKKNHEIIKQFYGREWYDDEDDKQCDDKQCDDKQSDHENDDENDDDDIKECDAENHCDDENQCDTENDEPIEIVNDIIENPLFDENNEKKESEADNKKSGWFGWLGWN